MNPTNEILNKLKKYPSLDYDSSDGYVTVHPFSNDGFTVRFDTVIGESDDPYIVSFEGWHEHFDDAEEALNCFAYGLSSKCRLRVHERGGKHINGPLKPMKMAHGYLTVQQVGSFFLSGVPSRYAIFKMI